MVTSQDSAAAAALRELGYDVTPVIEVVAVTDGTPAAGKLKVRDVLLEVGGIPIKSGEDVAKAVTAAENGEPIEFKVRRGGKDGKIVETSITPTTIDGAPAGGHPRSAPVSTCRSRCRSTSVTTSAARARG